MAFELPRDALDIPLSLALYIGNSDLSETLAHNLSGIQILQLVSYHQQGTTLHLEFARTNSTRFTCDPTSLFGVTSADIRDPGLRTGSMAGTAPLADAAPSIRASSNPLPSAVTIGGPNALSDQHLSSSVPSLLPERCWPGPVGTRQDSSLAVGEAADMAGAPFLVDTSYGGGFAGSTLSGTSKRQRLKSWISRKGSIATRSLLGSGASGISDALLEGEEQQGEVMGSKQLLSDQGEYLVNIDEFSITFK